MSIKDYLYRERYKITLGIVQLCIMNGYLLLIEDSSRFKGQLMYLNILLITLCLVFFILDYKKLQANYKNIHHCLHKDENAIPTMINGKDYESRLIKQIIDSKDRRSYMAAERYKKSYNEINDYITQWVHEIKIPLAICNLLKDRMLNSESQENLDISYKLDEALHSIHNYIEQVMYASRVANYDIDLSFGALKLDDVINDCVKQQRFIFIEKKIEIELESLNVQVYSDKKWLTYCLNQILNNAGKYAKLNGKIRIEATADEKKTILKISDNGVGILPRDLPYIFEKGFTGNNGRNEKKSTGMGLYHVKKMMNCLEHKIEVISKPQEFTQFIITFSDFTEYLRPEIYGNKL